MGVRSGQLSGKMTTTRISGRAFEEERERLKRRKKPQLKTDRASPFRRMVQSIAPGEGIKVCFENKIDYQKSIRTMYNINNAFRSIAKKRGIDNWHEFDMIQDSDKLVLFVKRNEFNENEEEIENGMAV